MDGEVRKRRRTPRPAAAPASAVRLGPLPEYVGYVLRRAQIAATAGFHEALKAVKLSPTQFSVLTVIRENPGVSPSEVCAALGIQKANFVPLLNELERRRLVRRQSGVADRRTYALHLTSEGEKLAVRAHALHEKHERRLLERLGRQGRDQLMRLLRRLIGPGT